MRPLGHGAECVGCGGLHSKHGFLTGLEAAGRSTVKVLAGQAPGESLLGQWVPSVSSRGQQQKEVSPPVSLLTQGY